MSHESPTSGAERAVGGELIDVLLRTLADRVPSASPATAPPPAAEAFTAPPPIETPGPRPAPPPDLRPPGPPAPPDLPPPATRAPPDLRTPSETPSLRDERQTPSPVRTDAIEESCVFVGPSGAGKTCTLAALSAACYVDAADPDCTMAVLNDPFVDAHDRLSQYAVHWIGFDDVPPATEQRRSYQVELSTRIEGRWLRPARLVVTSLRCSDGPGGTLFPSRADLQQGERMTAAQAAELLGQAAAATTLVLVIDSTAPAVELVETHLPGLLDRIAQWSGEELPQRAAVRMLQRVGLGGARSAPRRGRVRAGRVLLLLTKIDALALDVSRSLRARGGDVSPLEVAERIDPLGLALELLGERTLRRIRRAIGARADFAVALTSATGFHRRTGQTFLEWSRDQSADVRLKTWTPYGIHEALLYITTGRWGGPIQPVGTETELSLGDSVALLSIDEAL